MCEGMAFNLSDLGTDLRFLHDLIKGIHVIIKIADADRPDFSGFICFLQIMPRAHIVAGRMVQIDAEDLNSRPFWGFPI